MALQDIEIGPGKYDDTEHDLTPDEKVKNLEDFYKKQKQASTGGPVGSQERIETPDGKIRVTNSESKDEIVIDTSSLSQRDIDRLHNVPMFWY